MALSKRKLSPYFLFGVLLLLAWASFKLLNVFLDYVLVGLFFAYVTFPAYKWVQKRVRSPPLAAILLLMLTSALFLVPLSFLLVELVEEVRQILVALQLRDFNTLVQEVAASINRFAGRTSEAESVATAQFIQDIVREVRDSLAGVLRDLPVGLASGIVGVFVLLYVLYYAYIDGESFINYLKQALPMQESHRDLLFREIGNVVRAVMFGSVLTALIQGALGGLGFLFFGVPGVIFWSVIMFVLALLPIVGPPLVWVPASAYLFLEGRTFAAIGLFVYSAIMVSTVDNVVRPKLIGSRAHVHPVIILLGVLGGIAVFGFSGLVLGPLILSIFVTVVDVYRREFAVRMEDEDEAMAHMG